MKATSPRPVSEFRMAHFAGLCAMFSAGLLGLQKQQGMNEFLGGPKASNPVRDINILMVPAPRQSPETALVVSGEVIKLGKMATIEARANAQGVARLPLALRTTQYQAQSTLPEKIAHNLRDEQVSWDERGVDIKGLRPHGIYSVEAGLWLHGQYSSGSLVSVPEPQNVQECLTSCIAVFGKPELKALGPEASAIDRALVNPLASTHWSMPLLLLAGALAWRGLLQPATRRALVAVGAPHSLPLDLRAPEIDGAAARGAPEAAGGSGAGSLLSGRFSFPATPAPAPSHSRSEKRTRKGT